MYHVSATCPEQVQQTIRMTSTLPSTFYLNQEHRQWMYAACICQCILFSKNGLQNTGPSRLTISPSPSGTVQCDGVLPVWVTASYLCWWVSGDGVLLYIPRINGLRHRTGPILNHGQSKSNIWTNIHIADSICVPAYKLWTSPDLATSVTAWLWLVALHRLWQRKDAMGD